MLEQCRWFHQWSHPASRCRRKKWDMSTFSMKGGGMGGFLMHFVQKSSREDAGLSNEQALLSLVSVCLHWRACVRQHACACLSWQPLSGFASRAARRLILLVMWKHLSGALDEEVRVFAATRLRPEVAKRRRILATAPPEVMASWGDPIGLKVTAPPDRGIQGSASSRVPPVPRGALRRWPTRYRRRIDGVPDSQALTDAERAQRDRWLARGAKLLRECGLPTVEVADGALHPEGLLQKALGCERCGSAFAASRTTGSGPRSLAYALFRWGLRRARPGDVPL